MSQRNFATRRARSRAPALCLAALATGCIAGDNVEPGAALTDSGDPAVAIAPDWFAPSNGLARYWAHPAPQDLVLANAALDTTTGAVHAADGSVSFPPSYLVGDGLTTPALRVFVARAVRLSDITVASQDPRLATGPALVILALDDIIVEGRVSVAGSAGGDPSVGCRGGLAMSRSAPDGTGPGFHAAGSGGGGNATPGAPGGALGLTPAALGGRATSTATLEPLRGGCPGGGFMDQDANKVVLLGAPGGGAIQLTSATHVIIRGTLDARGSHGELATAPGTTIIGGGGAGGSILLEAPRVTLTSSARLLAKGGGGAALGAPPAPDDSIYPAAGTTCPGPCPDGGAGASPSHPARPGASDLHPATPFESSGGGGGGLGRIRINTATQTYDRAPTSIEAGALTLGALHVLGAPGATP